MEKKTDDETDTLPSQRTALGPTTTLNPGEGVGDDMDLFSGNVVCKCGTKLSPMAVEEFNVEPAAAFEWGRNNGFLWSGWFLETIYHADYIRVRETTCPDCGTKATGIAARKVVVDPSGDGQSAAAQED